MIFRPCREAKRLRSGRRAIVPSAFMISQQTAAGRRPASRQRSTVASVCPARTSTPPSRARSGNMWPGITRSSGLASGSTSTCTVRARSAAEMPVVTPQRASTDTVKPVPKCESLRPTISGMRSSSSRSARHGDADQAAAVAGHEVDGVGVDELGGQRQVALVLAVLVVDDDDEAPAPVLFDCLFDSGQAPSGSSWSL